MLSSRVGPVASKTCVAGDPKIPQIKEHTVEARKLEHGFRRISARIPYTLPSGDENNDVPILGVLL